MDDELPVMSSQVAAVNSPLVSLDKLLLSVLNHTPLNKPPSLYGTLDKSQALASSINKASISVIKLPDKFGTTFTPCRPYL